MRYGFADFHEPLPPPGHSFRQSHHLTAGGAGLVEVGQPRAVGEVRSINQEPERNAGGGVLLEISVGGTSVLAERPDFPLVSSAWRPLLKIS